MGWTSTMIDINNYEFKPLNKKIDYTWRTVYEFLHRKME